MDASTASTGETIWTDNDNHESCRVRDCDGKARLEICYYGFRVRAFDFPSRTDAMTFAEYWRPGQQGA